MDYPCDPGLILACLKIVPGPLARYFSYTVFLYFPSHKDHTHAVTNVVTKIYRCEDLRTFCH
jgi:hypothetical protein